MNVDHSKHEPAAACEHLSLGYCAVHDVAYCKKCQREWVTNRTTITMPVPTPSWPHLPGFRGPLMAGPGTFTTVVAPASHSAH